MHLPNSFLESLEGIAGFNREEFIRVHEENSQITSIRLNPFKCGNEMPSGIAEITRKPVPWCTHGFYLEDRPFFTFDPLFHAGCYYVQEASSMFMEQALKQLVDMSRPLRVLDLSAAPGGKSTHLLSLVSPSSLVVCNEVIKSRASVLTDNIIRWGVPNAVVTGSDPSVFGRMDAYFDVILVDAPCSGSGMFRKDPGTSDTWSQDMVQLCSMRQQRILADALPSLKPSGLLIYSTCSYARQENEEIAAWLVKNGMRSLSLSVPTSWGIVESMDPETLATGYRFFPHLLEGEGFFLGCFQKPGKEASRRLRTRKFPRADESAGKIAAEWLADKELELLRHRDELFCFPAMLVDDLSYLQDSLYLHYAGIRLGQVIRGRLVPDHSLAVGTVLAPAVPDIPLDYENAICYLKKGIPDLQYQETGWKTVSYMGYRLGWINALKNRVNNYYPPQLRIIKDKSG